MANLRVNSNSKMRSVGMHITVVQLQFKHRRAWHGGSHCHLPEGLTCSSLYGYMLPPWKAWECLTCGSFYGSISPPYKAWECLTCGSVMGQCHLLQQECWHATVPRFGYSVSLLREVQHTASSRYCLSYFRGYINMRSPCTNVGHAALKQSIKKALAAYAASPFLIEGMW